MTPLEDSYQHCSLSVCVNSLMPNDDFGKNVSLYQRMVWHWGTTSFSGYIIEDIKQFSTVQIHEE